jgi:type II secretory pathway pseudopilin PulG
MKRKKPENSRFGFTIIEVLVVFFIFILIADGAWLLYKNSVNTNTILSYNLTAQGEARRAFEEMSSAIRSASQSNPGAYTINNASSTAFVFYSDFDRDGLKEKIRYFLTGTILKKGTIKTTGNPLVYNIADEKISDLVHDVTKNPANPIFSYYDSNYDGTTAPLTYPLNLLAIRLVKITLIIDQNPNKAPAALTFTTQISIRNLKDNL